MRIAPSILSADFAALGEAIARVEAAGADQLHVDVMDGHFVPNLTIGPPVIESIRKRTRLPLDVHLMIEEPERWVETYVKAGADYLTIHVEACAHLERALSLIREAGARSGAVLHPDRLREDPPPPGPPGLPERAGLGGRRREGRECRSPRPGGGHGAGGRVLRLRRPGSGGRGGGTEECVGSSEKRLTFPAPVSIL